MAAGTCSPGQVRSWPTHPLCLPRPTLLTVDTLHAGAWQQWAAAVNVGSAGLHGWSLTNSCSSSGTPALPVEAQPQLQQSLGHSTPASTPPYTTSGWGFLPRRCYHHDSNSPYGSSSSASSSSYGYGPPPEVHATTILSVRKGGEVRHRAAAIPAAASTLCSGVHRPVPTPVM